jgi:hypothetical protein
MTLPRHLFVGLFVLGLARAQAPINDFCTGATGLEVGVNPAPPYGTSGAAFTNVGASMPSSPQFAGFGGLSDVFFSIQATCTGTTRVSLCTPPGFVDGSLSGALLTVFGAGSCTGVPVLVSTADVSCAGARPQVTFPSVAGASYLVRVASPSFTQGTFYVTVLPVVAAANDECATATPLLPGPNPGSSACTTPSTGAFLAACGTPPPIMGDAWHTVTAPFAAMITVTLSGAGADDFAVYAGACGALTPVACAGSGSPRTTTFAAVAGATYYVRTWKAFYVAGQDAYQLDVAFGAQPAADTCAAPTPLLAGVNPAPPAGASGATFSNVGATDQPGFFDPCGSGGFHDVFFLYTSDVDGPVRVSTCTPAGYAPGTLFDTMLAIYAADACTSPAPVALACNDDACEPYRSTLIFNAVYGVSYLVRVSSYSLGFTGTFYVTIDPSLNDACSAALPLAPGVVHGTTTIPACVGCTAAWYAFTPALSCDVVFSVVGLATPAVLEILLTPACTNLTPIAGPAPQAIVAGAAPGTTLWVRVITAAPDHFVLTVTCPTPPPNDEPFGAIPLVESPSAASGVGTITGDFHNFGATQSAGFATTSAPACGVAGRGPRSDVFFNYTTAFDGPAVIDVREVVGGGVPSPLLDTTAEVYAPLGTGYVLVACNDDATPFTVASTVRFFATAGTPYLLRVATSWDLASTAPNQHTEEGAFRIELSRPFAFDMDAPLGPGSIRLRNLNGPPGATALTVLTLLAGNFPNGFFFGIDPTLGEVQLALTYGAPFLNQLDPTGGSSFVVGPGLPPFTLYGVSLLLNPYGQLVAASAPEAFTIP